MPAGAVDRGPVFCRVFPSEVEGMTRAESERVRECFQQETEFTQGVQLGVELPRVSGL